MFLSTNINITINAMVIIVAVLCLIKFLDGYHKGFVKEVISLVSLFFMGIVVVILCRGLQSYMKKEVVGVVVAVILFTVAGIIHHFLSLVFFSAKLVSKLPVVSLVDKLAGAVFGVLEILVALNVLYILVGYYGLGDVGLKIMDCTRDSEILTFFYNHNFIEMLMKSMMESIPKVFEAIK